jgi:site-specific recombinase XerD
MFRHAFASSVRSGGAPLDVVQALLGHQSIHSTLIYNHTDQGELRRAIAAVPVPSNGR